MARLADLLGTEHPLFVYNLAQLEKAAGNDGVDIRLIADITQKAHRVLKDLGLDSHDTYPDELYQALNAAVRRGEAEHVLADTQYVIFMVEGEVVSMNLQDVIENSHHQLAFVDRAIESARRHLRMEVVKRYAEHEKTNTNFVHILTKDAGLMPEDDQNHQPIEATQPSADTLATPKVLAIGDIISDDFIDMTMSHINVSKDDEGYEWAAMELGGKIPYDNATRVDAVECSPNAAVSMSRLGLDVSLMSWIGDDDIGRDMVTYLKGQNVNTDSMAVEAGKKSNFHYVLRYGADRTKLQRFEDYSYQWQEPAIKPDWIYLGVLGEKTWPLHEAILQYLQDNPDIKLAFQPGMYHLKWGAQKLSDFYERAQVVIMNREEAAQVTGGDRREITELLGGLHELGVTVAVVTDGPAGAYASDDGEPLFMPNYPDPQPPQDRTGAGDAFASTLTTALALGESLETALTWAPINSMAVVQKLGAQEGLQTHLQIKEWLENAPEDYKVSQLKD